MKAVVDCSPGKSFPAVSVTGKSCDLRCDHCRGKYLEGMLQATTGENLHNIASKIKLERGKGILLSGGCDINGTVPLLGHIDDIIEISKLGLEINVHSGFISEKEAKDLISAGIDCFSVDVHQDPVIIFSVFHLKKTDEDYANLLDIIMNLGGKVVPHLTVGFGTYDLKQSAMLVKEKGLFDVVLNSLVPTKGTIAGDAFISEDAILSAVDMLQNIGLNITLGCMRDRSLRGLEIKCMEKGITRIANMSQIAKKWAADNGYIIFTDNRCCCMGID
ncbi:MAG: hypothetical protein RBR05_00060 [Candidatus Methanomethylophilaceae archaeon]|nr:hypothetical protein [Candidatus Methanomethylophilaceae archaeon]MDY0223779.1 hypothetical protein [Candidatus Methanomethylophilaceae archaeon]